MEKHILSIIWFGHGDTCSNFFSSTFFIVSEIGKGLWEPTWCVVQIMVKNVCAREIETNIKMSENL